MKRNLLVLLATLGLPLSLAAAPVKKPTTAATKKTTATTTTTTTAAKPLFDRLGGKKGITAVVDDFVANCAGDPRIKSFFAGTAADKTRLAGFKSKLVDQICEASGGPCKYTGKDMKTAHQGMGVTKAHFTALVEDLTKTLNKFKVGKTEQTQLLSVLGPMESDIVTSGPKS